MREIPHLMGVTVTLVAVGSIALSPVWYESSNEGNLDTELRLTTGRTDRAPSSALIVIAAEAAGSAPTIIMR